MKKLRVVYDEVNGKPSDFIYLERSESRRIRKILNLVSGLEDWTYASQVAKMIGQNVAAVISTLKTVKGALYIDQERDTGTEIVAEKPFYRLRKQKHNPRSNPKKKKYLRAPIQIKKP